MRRPLLHCLIALTLLLQGLGGAWAGSRMAAMETQRAAMTAAVSELPPCHQQAALAAMEDEGHAPGKAMDCCGSDSCQCVMGCGVVPLAVLLGNNVLLQRQSPLPGEGHSRAPRASHADPALRPPATLQS